MKKHVKSRSKKQIKRVRLPKRFVFGEDLKWSAPWIDVNLWVELPFWLMVDNTTVPVTVEGHAFQAAIHDNYFELFGGDLNDSKNTVIYRGPFKKLDDLSKDIQALRKQHPGLPLMWRKCKTVVKIATRCNQDVWERATSATVNRSPSVSHYLAVLCKAHMPVLNKLIQTYRLATYDYFAFEVAPWDAPQWLVECKSDSISAFLQPYQTWDIKPPVIHKQNEPPVPYQLIDAPDLASAMSKNATAGEFELLDALNFMERGDYSDAVRRITTAIEVIVAHAVGTEIESRENKAAGEKFLKSTKMNFPERVKKYQQITGRKLPAGLERELNETRQIRNRIVHGGYRISQGERGRAQRSVDTGRWLFNWIENDDARRKVREDRIAFRSLGRDLTDGIFTSKMQPDGVVVSLP